MRCSLKPNKSGPGFNSAAKVSSRVTRRGQTSFHKIFGTFFLFSLSLKIWILQHCLSVMTWSPRCLVTLCAFRYFSPVDFYLAFCPRVTINTHDISGNTFSRRRVTATGSTIGFDWRAAPRKRAKGQRVSVSQRRQNGR